MLGNKLLLLLQEIRHHVEDPITDLQEYTMVDDVAACTEELVPDWKDPQVPLTDMATDCNPDDIEYSPGDACWY